MLHGYHIVSEIARKFNKSMSSIQNFMIFYQQSVRNWQGFQTKKNQNLHLISVHKFLAFISIIIIF